jgi:Ca2+/Na+ antiporter
MYKPLDFVCRVSFCIFFLALIAGISFISADQSAYKQATLAGTVASSMVVICCTLEVVASKRAKRAKKVIWVAAFLLFNMVGALVYYLSERRRVMDTD